MKKTCLFFALAAALSLSACSDPDDQRGDPSDPTQQAATERDARQQELRDEENGRADASSDGRDPAREPDGQPASALDDDLYASDIDDLGDVEDPATVRTHTQEHVELQQELREMLGRTRADSRDQCALIPYGHKPCGGPESYIVYSQKDMSDRDIKELHEKVRRYNQLDAFIKSSQHMVGTCEVTPEPQIRFENGRCIADTHAGLNTN